MNGYEIIIRTAYSWPGWERGESGTRTDTISETTRSSYGVGPGDQPGSYVEYNNAAAGVVVTDTLPADVTFVSATPSQGSCSQTSGTVTCNLGIVNHGADATAAITVTPSVTAGGTTITNSTRVTGDQHDPNVGNNNAKEITKVDPAVDLVVTQVDSPDPVLVENSLIYTVTATNNGPSSATRVVVTDTLPADVTFVSATPSQGSCSQTSGTVTCNLGTLADGAIATVTIVVTPTTPGTLSNTVDVTSSITDTNIATNSTSAMTTSEPVPGPRLVFWGLVGVAGVFAVLIIFGFVRWYGLRQQGS